MAGAGGFDAWVRELFADLGSVHVRKMFGGAGVYAQGVMFQGRLVVKPSPNFSRG